MASFNNPHVNTYRFSQSYTFTAGQLREKQLSRSSKQILNGYYLGKISAYSSAACTPVASQFSLSMKEGLKVKYCGYNHSTPDISLAGTSKINKACMTSGFGPCVALSIGALHPKTHKAVEVCTFHLYQFNGLQQLQQYLALLKGRGLVVYGAMQGGTAGDKDQYISSHVTPIRQILAAHGVLMCIDEAGDKKPKDTKFNAFGIMMNASRGLVFLKDIHK